MRTFSIGTAAALVVVALTLGCEGDRVSGKSTEPAGAAGTAQKGMEGSAGEDAIETASGLIYTEVVEGTGDSPKASDVVVVHYEGTFPDGRVFDSSRRRGQPARFPLSRVIPCWTEALQRMRIGGKAKLVCPPEIAYGERGGGPIPPNATLHFEVELIDIVK